jgi:hypothetical protein
VCIPGGLAFGTELLRGTAILRVGGLSQARAPRQNRPVAYPPVLQAALNGDRVHPATPHSPAEIAAEAKAAVAAGAQSVHLHPYGRDGRSRPTPTLTTAPAKRKGCRRGSRGRLRVKPAPKWEDEVGDQPPRRSAELNTGCTFVADLQRIGHEDRRSVTQSSTTSFAAP